MKASIIRLITLWSVGAMTYGLLEILSRGFTHISMGILGGICFIIIDVVNTRASIIKRLSVRMLLCAFIITVLEFITGIIVNVWLRLAVWDYSEVPMNFCGQICLYYCVVWYLISYFGAFMSLTVRQLIFREDRIRFALPVLKRKSV